MVGITIQGKTVRIEALDILRGLFLVVILINHIALFPNIFMLFTGKSELWFSAAEGFMTVSGVLVGYIYTNKMKKTAKVDHLKATSPVTEGLLRHPTSGHILYGL